MDSKELREKFLIFFKKKGHKIVSSSSFLPSDPTVLFTTAGMQQFKEYYLGKPSPYGNRVTSCQKCFRTSDIEQVGDNKHLTFLEMLGNFSLPVSAEAAGEGGGDYFKKEAIEWALELLTKNFKIPLKKLWFTYFGGEKNIPEDKESLKVLKNLGIPKTKIYKKGREENFWGPTGQKGPCGPTVEIHYDLRGSPCQKGPPTTFHKHGFGQANYTKSDGGCIPNCECGRFVELWNLVFNEYYQNEDYNPPKDGSSREAGSSRVPNTFQSQPTRPKKETPIKEKRLTPLKQKGVDTGMGLERLAMILQQKESVFETDLFLPIVSEIKKMVSIEKVSGPSAFERLFIPSVVLEEELKSRKYQRYLRIIADHVKGSVFLASEGILPSNVERGYVLRRIVRRAIRYGKMLNLPQNFLIPLTQKVIEIYKDIYPEVESKKTDVLTILQKEEEKFGKMLERGITETASEISRKGRLTGEIAFNLYQSYGMPLEFSKEIAIGKGAEISKNLEIEFKKALRRHREISRAGAEKKFGGVGKEVSDEAAKLHTATHLLHAALRKILGPHVKQMGSDITAERLRFDFSHPKKMTPEEIQRVEALVNQKIKEDLEVKTEKMSYEQALKSGALAFFKEKYPEMVSVYSIDDPSDPSGQAFSKEICAGPHVKKSSELGLFKIIKEESSGSGVRRIRAILE